MHSECRMFSQLTVITFRIFFKYFSTWNTPFQWNDETREIELTTNKFQLLRWKLSSVFTFAYTGFIIIRMFPSVHRTDIPMNELILQFPQLFIFLGNVFGQLTITLHANTIIFIFKQMVENNRVFGSGLKLIPKKWDGIGVFTLYMIFVASTYPYACGCYFYFNRHENTFLYSLIDASGQRNNERVTVFLIFLYVEILSIHCVCNSLISLYFITSVYFVHTSYWMTLDKARSQLATAEQNIRKFQILFMHTSRFNEAFSKLFLLPLKEILSVVVVVCSVALIRFHNKLELESFVLLWFMVLTASILLTAIYHPAGRVWKVSLTLKNHIGKKDWIKNRRRNFLWPFGIMIGSFYVVKNYTFLSLTHILLKYIFRLLVAMKVPWDGCLMFAHLGKLLSKKL